MVTLHIVLLQVTDTIDDVKGGYGGVQFGEAGCSTLGDPTSGGGSSSSGSSSGGGGGEVSTEATSVQRADVPAPTPAPTRRHRNVQKSLDSQARLLIPTDSPTDSPTASPTDAPTDAPTDGALPGGCKFAMHLGSCSHCSLCVRCLHIASLQVRCIAPADVRGLLSCSAHKQADLSAD